VASASVRLDLLHHIITTIKSITTTSEPKTAPTMVLRLKCADDELENADPVEVEVGVVEEVEDETSDSC
jgi:hypothetical protein